MNNEYSGKIINLLSNDATRVEMFHYFLPFLIISPIQAIIIIFLLIKFVNISILSGVVLLLIAIPAQSLSGKILDRLRFVLKLVLDSN